MNIEDLKGAIAELSEADRLSLTSWLNLQAADDWDIEMARDFAPGGRGASALERFRREAAAGLASGTAQPLEDSLAERENRQ